MPYSGNYRGCFWNAQALWAARTSNQNAKFGLLTRLLDTHDFAGVVETHGTDGKVRGRHLPAGTVAFWSWNLAGWRCFDLKGPLGNLDLFVAYLATGGDRVEDQASRRATIDTLHLSTTSQTSTLSIYMGDWNFVMEEKDRWCKTSGAWTGARDHEEKLAFEAVALHPHRMHELEQDLHTFHGGLHLARLDRIYSNHHVLEQIDKSMTCTALQRTRLSGHRPLSFSCRKREKLPSDAPNLNPHHLRNARWAKRVAAELEELEKEDARTNDIRRLVLAKRAMSTVSSNMQREEETNPARSIGDQLSCTLSFIRAAEKTHVRTMRRRAADYPEIREYVDPKDPEARSRDGFQRLKDHALDVARQSLTEEMRDLAAAQLEPNDPRRKARKEHILRKLKRLVPGASDAIKAVKDPEHGMCTSPEEIARWEWRVSHQDVAHAISHSENTMPGPDGIPFQAWRQLGPLGVDILTRAAWALEREDAEDLLIDGYRDESDESDHFFNLSTLVCLPKKAAGTTDNDLPFFLPEGTPRCFAYADDAALVIDNITEQGPRLARLFDEFSRISGLDLNLGKCIVIPLDGGNTTEFQQQLAQNVPAWGQMQVRLKGKYLGFIIGPAKEEESWREPLEKYVSRCRVWYNIGEGLQYSALVYNTFVASVLTFVMQLERLPDESLTRESQVLQQMAKGPGGWFLIADLFTLKERFGMAKSFHSLAWLALSARCRVGSFDRACSQGRLRELSGKLARARGLGLRPHVLVEWREWFKGAFVLNLEQAQDYVHRVLGGMRKLQNSMADDVFRKKFQKVVYQGILDNEAPHALMRVRHKLNLRHLWDASLFPQPPGTSVLQSTPHYGARRALRQLQELRAVVAPRVQSAVFSTMWNRWTTHRRFQQRHAPTNRCLLGCPPGAEDSIEHCCRCPLTARLLQRRLNLDASIFGNLHTFMLTNIHIKDEETLCKVGLLIYAVYNAVNSIRHSEVAPEASFDCMCQSLREAAKRHRYSTAVLDGAFRTPRGASEASEPTQGSLADGAFEAGKGHPQKKPPTCARFSAAAGSVKQGPRDPGRGNVIAVDRQDAVARILSMISDNLDQAQSEAIALAGCSSLHWSRRAGFSVLAAASCGSIPRTAATTTAAATTAAAASSKAAAPPAGLTAAPPPRLPPAPCACEGRPSLGAREERPARAPAAAAGDRRAGARVLSAAARWLCRPSRRRCADGDACVDGQAMLRCLLCRWRIVLARCPTGARRSRRPWASGTRVPSPPRSAARRTGTASAAGRPQCARAHTAPRRPATGTRAAGWSAAGRRCGSCPRSRRTACA
ncbi:unnamed protein product [Prorocentrum cordatum]|uniref:Reverse transcriptase domain-containing protein n=1 Tax=Prorocentrum cordatum TaxID=2364126 RepID=A0ABN9XF02_9DINO|nr:unnamed protein product [Polarella glacialis]